MFPIPRKLPVNKFEIFRNIILKGSLPEKKNLLFSLYEYINEPPILKSSPLFLQIEPTNYCNLKCLTCHNPDLGEHFHMSFENYKHIISQFPFLRKINMVGMGEPLMNPAIIDMISYATQRNISIGIATNGILLTEKMSAKLLGNGLQWLNISVDSAEKEKYEELRPNADFDVLMKNITDFVKIRNEKKMNIDTGLAVVIGTHNIDELEAIIDLTVQLGIGRIFAQTIHFWGLDSFREKMGDWTLTGKAKEYLDKLVNARRYATEKKIALSIENLPDTKSARACKWPWKTCYITAGGYVTPCCMQGADPEIINFGNIFETNFSEIFNNNAYQKFRESLKSAKPPSICLNCPSYFKTIKIENQ